jgi:hypothetical protein
MLGKASQETMDVILARWPGGMEEGKEAETVLCFSMHFTIMITYGREETWAVSDHQ